jgi:molybdopterin molybdotransferase
VSVQAPAHDHADAGSLLSLDSALARMLGGIEPLAAEEVEIASAHGRVLAAPVDSRHTLPPWDNSAMDGFAVRAADVESATPAAPIRLRVVGEAAAGRLATAAVEPRTAVRILTGAPLPAGADSVVPVEDTDAPAGAAEPPASVGVMRSARIGAHVRRQGSDLRVGDALLAGGTTLDAAALAVATAGGHGTLAVHRRPRVAILASGDELVAPGGSLGPAQIPDSNSVGLAAQAAEAGADVRRLGIAADRLDDVLRLLGKALEWADVVVVSGGVSVGAHDVVKAAFESLGRLELWRVAVQPGKPLAFGRASVARDGGQAEVLLFGLPGNPVSSFVTFELFVRPVLRRLSGLAATGDRETVRATLAEGVSSDIRRRTFVRVRLEHGAQPAASGEAWRATVAGGQGSHVLSALAAADGLAIVPEGVGSLAAGAEVDVIRIRSGG